jgi:hypothetical protein
MAGDGFPDVTRIPAHADRYAVKASRQIDAIVLHMMAAVDARQTARSVFGQPEELGADGNGAGSRRTTSSGGTEPSSSACAIRTLPSMRTPKIRTRLG